MTDVPSDPAAPPTGNWRGRLASGVRPRLIATDLDGTIIGYDHTRSGFVTARTVRAFRAARDAGIHVVFVTGRPVRWLSPLVEHLGHTGVVICSNGAVVYDLEAEAVLESSPVPGPAVLQAQELLRQVDPEVGFGVETLAGFRLDSRFRSGREPMVAPGTAVPPVKSLDAVLGALSTTADPDSDPDLQVVKLLATSRTHQPDAFLARARELLGDLVTVTHSAPGLALLEMSAPGVDKAATLERYAARHGVAAQDVVAFGDMPNDLEMITWAGTGVAVGSGHPALLAAADLVAPACDDDGVAQVIEAILGA